MNEEDKKYEEDGKLAGLYHCDVAQYVVIQNAIVVLLSPTYV